MTTTSAPCRIILLTLALLLSACGTRPGPNALIPIDASAYSHHIPVYVASTREVTQSHTVKDLYIFNEHRSDTTNYARYEFSVPHTHRSSVIEWSNTQPDPNNNFAVTNVEILDKQSFFNTLAPKDEKVGIGLFIHGYNTNYPESLYRSIQLAADSTVKGRSMLFAWPSQGSWRGYLSDKEAVLYSRDALVDLLKDFNNRQNIDNVVIVAHSMGAFLLMESLRQLRLQNDHAVYKKLNVILAMPDIDQDVFKKQVETIGTLPTPITILVTPQDRAIKLSSLLSFAPRIGTLDINAPDVQRMASENTLRIIDVTALPSTYMGHDRYVNIGTLLPSLIKDSRNQTTRTKQSTGVFIFDALTETLDIPFMIMSEATNKSLSGNP